jgi:hypothetical protein
MVSGRSFSQGHRYAALAGSIWLAVWGWQTLPEATYLHWQEWAAVAFFVLTLFTGLVYVWTSATTVTDEYIEEKWLVTKRIALTEIVKCKLVDVPRMRWLITPRILIKTDGITTYTFRVADPAVLAQLKEVLHRHTGY